MRTNLEWKAWGDKDPLWGVATWAGRQKGGARPWTDSEFYALGDDWLDFEERWTRYGLVRGGCLEIGCGAGRITARLAQAFDEVVAVDVSQGMLDYAVARVTAPNITWALSDGLKLPCGDAAIDAVFSCSVFQHFPSVDAGLAVFREIRRVLKPRGTFMIHLPLHHFSEMHKFAKLATPIWNCLSVLASARNALRRFCMKFGGPPPMSGVSYDEKPLFDALVEMGFSRVEFVVFPVRTAQGSLYSCVLGTNA
jgi:SAM-dependent methyltransferase